MSTTLATNTALPILVKKRRATVMRIINENSASGNSISRASLFYLVSKDPYIAEYFPQYTLDELKHDLSHIGNSFDKENNELRLLFLSENIADTQDAIGLLKDFATDEDVSIGDRIKALNSLRAYIELQLNILGNMPDKRISIDKRVVRVDLEDFLRAKEKAETEVRQKIDWEETSKQFDQLFVEGEVEEEE